MNIEKGQKLIIKNDRKGTFKAVAEQTFNTKEEEFYPVCLAVNQYVGGKSLYWEAGESIPCRANLCTIKKMVENKQ